MVDRDVIKEWITKADQDFEFARINFEEEKQFFAQICFHFNQSAEKYLKAFIIANRLEFRKIHDLHLLLKQCKSNDPSFSQLEDDCEYLTTFYIETRYPVHWPTAFTKEEAEKAHRSANNIREFIKKKLQHIVFRA
ncbi:MAG: HEPN domain-containing protein [Desulfobacterales bacterium]|jgi:HEPN domain-containing protein